MRSVSIGDLVVTADDESISFAHRSHRGLAVHLSQQGMEELVRFLACSAQSKENLRRAFRVPVPPSSGLSITLKYLDDDILVRAIDISMTGCRIRLDCDLNIEIGSTFDVTVRLQQHVLSLCGVVRWRRDDEYGISFQEVGQEEPPPLLAQIVMAVQRSWVASRTS